MDSERNLKGRVGHLARFDAANQPHFQHKRRNSPSPSRYAREPNLPVRKKSSQHLENSRAERDNEYFILGDQSRFSTDSVPYRTRSLSAPRYPDSADMLMWVDGDDDDAHNNRRSNRHGGGDDNITSDHHYHKCADEFAQNGGTRPALRSEEVDRNASIGMGEAVEVVRSPKRVHLASAQSISAAVGGQQSGQKISSAANGASQAAIVANKNTSNSDERQKKGSSARRVSKDGLADGGFRRGRKSQGREFVSRSDVGKFLFDERRAKLQEEKVKQAAKVKRVQAAAGKDGQPGKKYENKSETKNLNKTINSNESLGEAIVKKSNENKGSFPESQIAGAPDDRGSRRQNHHSSGRSLSEYQDEFKWKLPVASSANLHRSSPRLSSVAVTSDPRPREGRRPRSAVPPINHRRQLDRHLHHHNHHNNAFRDSYYDEIYSDGVDRNNNVGHDNDLVDADNLVRKENFSNTNNSHDEVPVVPFRGEAEDDDDDDDDNYLDRNVGRANGKSYHHDSTLRLSELTSATNHHDRQEINHHNNDRPRHHHHHYQYKSEYAKKFIPPDSYLMLDGSWVKTNHLRVTDDLRPEVTNKDPKYSSERYSGNSFGFGAPGREERGGRERRISGAEEVKGRPGNFDGRSEVERGRGKSLRSSNDAFEGGDFNDSGDSWFDYILQLRRKADEYKHRGYGSIFSRDHLAQIRSDKLHFWDVSSSNSSATDEAHDRRLVNSAREEYSYRSGNHHHHHQKRTDAASDGGNELPRNRPNKRVGEPDFRRSESPSRISHQDRRPQNFGDGVRARTRDSRIAGNFGNVDVSNRSIWQRNDPNPILSSEDSNNNERGKTESEVPGIRYPPRNSAVRDNSDLSESLSGSLSLAEEVLERARTRKDRLWLTK